MQLPLLWAHFFSVPGMGPNERLWGLPASLPFCHQGSAARVWWLDLTEVFVPLGSPPTLSVSACRAHRGADGWPGWPLNSVRNVVLNEKDWIGFDRRIGGSHWLKFSYLGVLPDYGEKQRGLYLLAVRLPLLQSLVDGRRHTKRGCLWVSQESSQCPWDLTC